MSTVQKIHATPPGHDGAHADLLGTIPCHREAQSRTDGAHHLGEDVVQRIHETHRCDDHVFSDAVLSGPGHSMDETQSGSARSADQDVSRGLAGHETQLPCAPADYLDPERVTAIHELRLFARAYWDAQDARKRIGQRFSAPVSDADMLVGIRAAAKASEDLLGKAMEKCFIRAFPEVSSWVGDTPGVGRHLVARLLGEIGHPILATPMAWEKNAEGLVMESGTVPKRVLVPAGDPYMRSVGQLWAYCGVGAPERRRKGMTQEETLALGKASAKTLVYLVATSAIKFTGAPHTQRTRSSGDGSVLAARPKIATTRRRSPYRDIYDLRRLVTAEREWTDGHRHADALRIVGKRFLADMYDVCKDDSC